MTGIGELLSKCELAMDILEEEEDLEDRFPVAPRRAEALELECFELIREFRRLCILKTSTRKEFPRVAREACFLPPCELRRRIVTE